MNSRILGIDPGYNITGYAVIDADRNSNRLVASGTIKLTSDLPDRLRQVFNVVTDVIRTHAPNTMAVENVFFHRDAQAALKLGQVRGTAICAAALSDLPVHEYSVKFIKKAVVGRGGASKDQVKFMVARLLQIAERTSDDEADAMAIALCHAFTGLSRINLAKEQL